MATLCDGKDAKSEELSHEGLSLEFDHLEKGPINQWEQLMNVDELVAIRRSKHTIVQFNESSIYVFGGDNGKAMLNDLVRYDVRDKSWKRVHFTIGSPPAPRYHHSASIYGRSMFIFGGYTGDIHSNSNLKNRNDLFEYNMATGQWSEIKYEGKNFPKPRSAHGAAVYDDKLWIFAGYDGNVRLNDLWYIPLNRDRKEWTLVDQKGQCPPTCCNFPVAVESDNMFVFSGQSGAKTTNDLFMFHFKTQTWTQISFNATEHILHGGPISPTKRYGHTMTAHNRQLYVFGGSASADTTLPSDLHCFDLNTMTWSILVPTSDICPSGRLYHAAVMIDDTMYIFGGTNNKNVRSSELFRFRFGSFPRCTLHADFENLLAKNVITDITFIISEEKEILPLSTSEAKRIDAHIAIVAARSPFLRNLIRVEKNSPNSESNAKLQIYLNNINPVAFEVALEYMYTDKIDPTKRDMHAGSNQMVLLMMDVYILSVKFKITRLEHLCVQYLKAAINIDNVLVAVQNADRLKLDFIKESCMKFIVKESNFTDIVMSNEFETLSKEQILEIIRRKHRPAIKSQESSQSNLCDTGCCSLGRTLARDMEIFLTKTGKEFSDIKLQINQDITSAHKAILAARCSFFQGLFKWPASESSSTSTSSSLSTSSHEEQLISIKIGEIIPSSQSFITLLKYIYYGNVDMPPEDLLYLFSAPSYYGFTNNRFHAFCKHILETGVNFGNVFKILMASERINANEMKKHALDIIVSNYKDLFRLPTLKELPKELLLDILTAIGETGEVSHIIHSKEYAKQ